MKPSWPTKPIVVDVSDPFVFSTFQHEYSTLSTKIMPEQMSLAKSYLCKNIIFPYVVLNDTLIARLLVKERAQVA